MTSADVMIFFTLLFYAVRLSASKFFLMRPFVQKVCSTLLQANERKQVLTIRLYQQKRLRKQAVDSTLSDDPYFQFGFTWTGVWVRMQSHPSH